jgi:hypothetical protein
MSCGCVYAGNDGDIATFYRAKTYRARHVHVCNECGETIQPGEIYEYVSAYWCGDFDVLKTCATCLAVRSEFFCGNFTHRAIWEDLHCHIEDIGDDFDVDCLAGLPKAARDRVCDLIEDCWEATE